MLDIYRARNAARFRNFAQAGFESGGIARIAAGEPPAFSSCVQQATRRSRGTWPCSGTTECGPKGFVRDISGLTGTMRYMNKFISAVLGVLPRWRGRANSVLQLWESAELKDTRRCAVESLRRASTGTPVPLNIHERLREEAWTLELIERRREEEDNPHVGLNVEEQILTSELRDLALATLADDMGVH